MLVLIKNTIIFWAGLAVIGSMLLSSSLAWSQPIKKGDIAALKRELMKKEEGKKRNMGLAYQESQNQQEPLYWYDGKLRREVRIDATLQAFLYQGSYAERILQQKKMNETKKAIVSDYFLAVVSKEDADSLKAINTGEYIPVFRNLGGGLMVLSGGVVLIFNKNLTEIEIEKFFRDRDIPNSSYKKNPDFDRLYTVEAEPGLPSLELANKLSLYQELLVSSPEWWQSIELY